MIRLLYIFLFVVFCKIILNLSKYLEIKSLFRKYEKYNGSDPLTTPSTIDFISHQQRIKKLFRDANLENPSVPIYESVFLGPLFPSRVSVFENMQYTREDVVVHIKMLFYQAEGVFLQRIKEAINPIYWLETLIYLPKKIFIYLGIPIDRWFVKISIFVWWVFITLGNILYVIYKPEIDIRIKQIIMNFMK
ncbi:MAG: hypothetical protein JXA91_00580 [Candidatus Thermoplasmatota archaeon]|nr:hypothetical protein [Candidatus Thermoplasmatota archaeon]